ncbi:MAG: bifunctional phosphopantothenoylcysteine decarboxylase/phosphopantothenate--cysteine ligase CoaBC [Gammaproteobacteria bacterium]|nr:bifunctional phosphopantothenoylcysteine decarboxylase/phosphopantothenate--cysteine ligase CoaBC [Gammaproteobacteria bacterium]MYF37307.1 bifunctional phosphopantothenoylcysteine decarboxylase/phosphopantothenate--cysteine ligase CoaBC [Gammaproteobacteria bacterium]
MRSKKVLLGITGGIAAYKVPELIRLLVAEHHEVAPIMTRSAHKFVTEHTLSALTSQRVRTDLWDLEAERAMGHIELAKWPDTFVVAPASANTIAKLAQGRSNDLLSTAYLATTSQVVIVPAMNQAMWLHPATQRNIAQLKQDGVCILEPEHGEQACGDIGPGRMPEPEDILSFLKTLWEKNSPPALLKNLKVLVSAGPTQERIDPVRFLSNRSSGKQGFEIARAAIDAGAEVTLVSGPVNLKSPTGVELVNVQTAAEMNSAVMTRIDQCDVFFAVAAVADFQPKQLIDHKLKRPTNSNPSNLTLELETTEDIVRAVTSKNKRPFVVGFAAETNDVLQNAREKLIRKNLDVIVVNDVSDPTIGFDSDENQVTVVFPETESELKKQSKKEIAQQVIELVADALPRSN